MLYFRTRTEARKFAAKKNLAAPKTKTPRGWAVNLFPQS